MFLFGLHHIYLRNYMVQNSRLLRNSERVWKNFLTSWNLDHFAFLLFCIIYLQGCGRCRCIHWQTLHCVQRLLERPTVRPVPPELLLRLRWRLWRWIPRRSLVLLRERRHLYRRRLQVQRGKGTYNKFIQQIFHML